MSLSDAQRELAENPPPEMTPETHPLSFAGIGELLDQREQQGEEAEPAA